MKVGIASELYEIFSKSDLSFSLSGVTLLVNGI